MRQAPLMAKEQSLSPSYFPSHSLSRLPSVYVCIVPRVCPVLPDANINRKPPSHLPKHCCSLGIWLYFINMHKLVVSWGMRLIKNIYIYILLVAYRRSNTLDSEKKWILQLLGSYSNILKVQGICKFKLYIVMDNRLLLQSLFCPIFF